MIRPATPADVAEIHELVCDLAEFEKLRHTVVSTPDDFHAALFGERPLMEAVVVEQAANADTPGKLSATALFYPTFSTFTGKSGLWLEDVYVRPECRGQGIGRAILDHFLELARSRGCARAEWSVLDWNTDAIRLYENLGASVMPDWRIARVSID
jgi:hypothetical protein